MLCANPPPTGGMQVKFPTLENGMITGQLLPAERLRIAEVLTQKGGPKACECCGAENWNMGEYIVSPYTIARHPTHFRPAPADPFFPSVLLFCGNCGNTRQLNLVILGLGDELFPRESVGEK